MGGCYSKRVYSVKKRKRAKPFEDLRKNQRVSTLAKIHDDDRESTEMSQNSNAGAEDSTEDGRPCFLERPLGDGAVLMLDEDVYEDVANPTKNETTQPFKTARPNSKPMPVETFIRKIPSADSAFSDEQSVSSKSESEQDSVNHIRIGQNRDRRKIAKLKTSQKEKGKGFELGVLLPHMIEAYRPLIEGSVRVNEILPHLTFLDDREAIQMKERESPRKSVRLLLEQIIASEELGKWTAFLDALNAAGYKYIVNILRADTEVDHSIQREILLKLSATIAGELEPGDLIEHLYAKDVISIADKEEIGCELKNRGPSAASLMLLDRIPRRNQNWYREFLDVLRACKCDHVADELEMPNACLPPTDCTTPNDHKNQSEITTNLVNDGYITVNFLPSDELTRKDHVSSIQRDDPLRSNRHLDSEKSVTENRGKNPDTEIDTLEMKRVALAKQLHKLKEKQMIKKEIKKLEEEIQALLNSESDTDVDVSDDRSQNQLKCSDFSMQTDQVMPMAEDEVLFCQKTTEACISSTTVRQTDDNGYSCESKVTEGVLKELLLATKAYFAEEFRSLKEENEKSLKTMATQCGNHYCSLPPAHLPRKHLHTFVRNKSTDSGVFSGVYE